MPAKMKNYLKRAMDNPLEKSINEVDKKTIKIFEDNIKLVLDNNWNSIIKSIDKSILDEEKETFINFSQALKNVVSQKSWLMRTILQSNFKHI